MTRRPPRSPLFPYTPLFESILAAALRGARRVEIAETDRRDSLRPRGHAQHALEGHLGLAVRIDGRRRRILADRLRPSVAVEDRKSTRLNSSHSQISYAVFCL